MHTLRHVSFSSYMSMLAYKSNYAELWMRHIHIEPRKLIYSTNPNFLMVHYGVWFEVPGSGREMKSIPFFNVFFGGFSLLWA